MVKLRHSRLQEKKLSTVMLVLSMLFLLMLLGQRIFSLPINDDDSPPNDLTSYRRMASERVRTSSGMFLRRGKDKIIMDIEKMIADYTFIPVEWRRSSSSPL